jgi:hypothetical protein
MCWSLAAIWVLCIDFQCDDVCFVIAYAQILGQIDLFSVCVCFNGFAAVLNVPKGKWKLLASFALTSEKKYGQKV